MQLCVSVEDQAQANARIPYLLQTPAAVRGISAEPLLAAVDLRKIVIKKSTDLGPDVSFDSLKGWNGGALRPDRCGLDWVIVGGESGRGARPMNPDWVRSLRDQSQRQKFHSS